MKKLSSIILFILVLTSVQSVKAQCQAGYTYLVTGGMVQFSDSSNGTSGAVGYFWDFGNGDTANIANPSPPLVNGSYNVCLTITDSICTNTLCDTVVVGCTANFTYTDNGAGSFSFVNMSTGGFVSETWDFGDGQSFTPPTYPIVHNYSTDGVYTVTVSIWDSLTQCNNSTNQTITVVGASSCGTPNFTYIDNTDGNASFFNSSTNASNYTWDFGNGNTSTQVNPTFYYQPAGTYFVCLTINDSCNNVFCDSVIVTDTSGTACLGAASFTFIDNGGGNISFNNTSANTVSSFWTFGDGGTSLSYSPNNTYSTDGNYLVVLTVTDSNACISTISQMVSVSGALNVCSMASFVTTDNGSGLWSFSSTSSGSPTSYVWDFGDGTQTSGQSPNHLYNVDGIYVVVLTVFDSILGCSNSTNSIITISGATGGSPCNSAFVVIYDTASTNVLVYNTSTGINITYDWSFGDGNFSTLQNPNYTYSGNGPYGLCLTVDNGSGCISTYCDSIFGGGTVMKQTGFSISVITLILTSINDNVIIDTKLDIFPNPVNDELTINFEIKKASSVDIYATDLLGNVVANVVNQKNIEGVQQVKWNTKSIPNGVYLLNVKTKKSIQVRKVVVSK